MNPSGASSIFSVETVALRDRVTEDFESIWKEAVEIQVLSWYLPGV